MKELENTEAALVINEELQVDIFLPKTEEDEEMPEYAQMILALGTMFAEADGRLGDLLYQKMSEMNEEYDG